MGAPEPGPEVPDAVAPSHARRPADGALELAVVRDEVELIARARLAAQHADVMAGEVRELREDVLETYGVVGAATQVEGLPADAIHRVEDGAVGAHGVAHVQHVPHLPPVAVEGDGLSPERLEREVRHPPL